MPKIRHFRKTILYKRKTRFHLVGHVSEIVTYPVKGMRGVALTRGKITNLGIFVGSILDRGFMVVNQETKTMVNAKQHPKLVSVLVEICGEGDLILSVPNMEKKLVLRKPESLDKIEDVPIYIPCPHPCHPRLLHGKLSRRAWNHQIERTNRYTTTRTGSSAAGQSFFLYFQPTRGR